MPEDQQQLPIIGEPSNIEQMLETLGEDVVRDKWPAALVEHVDILRSSFQLEGMSEKEARKNAYTAINAIATLRGGKVEYLPKGESLERAITHKQMFDDWYTGTSLPELAKKYKMTELALYPIIRTQRKLHSSKIQPELFPKELV